MGAKKIRCLEPITCEKVIGTEKEIIEKIADFNAITSSKTSAEDWLKMLGLESSNMSSYFEPEPSWYVIDSDYIGVCLVPRRFPDGSIRFSFLYCTR